MTTRMRCLYCHHEIEDGEDCPMPECVDARIAAQNRMGGGEDYPDPDDYDRCTNPEGHEWSYTGTAYGGDDPRWMGEGRCLCVHCGADGDA